MRTIKKGTEPPLLAVYRKSTGAAFDYLPTDVKNEIKERLIKEQRGLCCYCQSRIRATWDGMKVEHWKSQSPDKYPEHQLDYSNLLGACSGGQKHGESSPKENHHCDTMKGDSDLCFPLCDIDRPIEKKIKYSSSGKIYSDDKDIDEAINKVLNLNLKTLQKNRKSALDAMLQSWGKRTIDFKKELGRRDDSSSEELEPFSQIIVFYLLKKISKQEAK